MTAACEGYACPPEHSVPVSEVIVHRPAADHLATTGAPDPTGLVAIAFTLALAGALCIRWARPGRK